MLIQSGCHLWIEKFLLIVDGSKYNVSQQCQEELEMSKTNYVNDVPNMWKECRELATEFLSDLEHFINQVFACNEQFRYWSIFLDKLIPIVNDLTLSIRESNWLLYLFTLRRAMPLFFAFVPSNFS